MTGVALNDSPCPVDGLIGVDLLTYWLVGILSSIFEVSEYQESAKSRKKRQENVIG